MRLTLRTLIAWLDDTLTPTEVREIGQQVSESPFAKELVERVQRVTRQRRLTVPGESGADATDANQVASYLDNQLQPEQVADYEKRCLTSDVHLAEVASIHQILSLIGHKAKVPADAKLRMYRLVRGREATAQAPPRTARAGRSGERTPITEPIANWSNSLPRRRPLIERFGPPAVVLSLILVMGLMALYSLNPESRRQPVAIGPAVPANPQPQPAPAIPDPEPVKPPAPAKADPVAAPPAPDPRPEPARPEDVARPGEAGSFDVIRGVVLRPSPENVGWDRVEARAPLAGRSRLINLAPFRNTLKLGQAEVELVDSTDVILGEPERDQPAPIELVRGRLVLHAAAASSQIAVRFEGRVVAITPPPGVNLGIERIPTLMPGQAEPAPARLRIFVPEGQATFKVGDTEEKLNGPAEISLQTSGQFAEKGRQPTPGWVTESAPSTFVKEIGDQFNNLLRPGRPILANLVEAMDDPQKDVKRMAVYALGSIGAMEMVATVLDRKEDPAIHRAVVEVIRTGLAQGGDSAKAVRVALDRQYDQPWAGITELLIVGNRSEDARDEAKLAKLVEHLTAPNRGTRELALDNLRALTGRDNLEYDPDAPEGKGLKAWQDLVRKKEAGKEARPASNAPR
jgi:hypothetical protein